MTSDAPDQPVKPHIIDLDAEDVTIEDTAPPSAPLPPTPPNKSTFAGKWLLLALLGGAIAGGWVYKDFISSYLPSNEMLSAQARIEALEAQTKTLSGQLASIADNASQAKSQVGTVEATINDAVEKLSTASATLETRVVAAEATVKTARAEIEKLKSTPISGTAPTTSGGDNSPLISLAQRVDSLEKDMASLKAVKAPTDQSTVKSALSQSLSDLKAKISSGVSYAEEFERISRMVPAAAGLDALGTHANEGLPNAGGLAAELNTLIPTLPKAEIETSATDGTYMDSFWNALKGVITIRRIGEADWPQLAAQCAALAESGDLAQAIEKIDAAEGSKPSGLTKWRDRAAARIDLEKSLEQTSDAITRQIASMGAAQ
jgi:hypothetical protein